jgi:hypothetical protein
MKCNRPLPVVKGNVHTFMRDYEALLLERNTVPEIFINKELHTLTLFIKKHTSGRIPIRKA